MIKTILANKIIIHSSRILEPEYWFFCAPQLRSLSFFIIDEIEGNISVEVLCTHLVLTEGSDRYWMD